MNQSTLDKMKHLKLYGMHRAFTNAMEVNSQSYTNDELVAYLIDSEYDDRESRKVERRKTDYYSKVPLPSIYGRNYCKQLQKY